MHRHGLDQLIVHPRDERDGRRSGGVVRVGGDVGFGGSPITVDLVTRALRELTQRGSRTVGLGGTLEEALRRSSLQVPADGWATFVDGAEELGGPSVDGQGRAVAIDEAHVTAVFDEVREGLCIITHPRVIIATDPDVRLEEREAARSTDETVGNFNGVLRELAGFAAGLELRS